MPGPGIFNIFAASPIKPLQAHIEEVLLAVCTLPKLVEALNKQEFDIALKEYETIAEREKSADKIKQEIRTHLPQSLFLPVARSDILELLSAQDQLANKAKDIAGLMLGRKMQIPEVIAADFISYMGRCIEVAKLSKKAINELDELLETGFKGHEVNFVETIILDIDALELETDKLQIQIRNKLFEMEDEQPPVAMMFLYRVVEAVGALADKAQRIGHRLQILVAR